MKFTKPKLRRGFSGIPLKEFTVVFREPRRCSSTRATAKLRLLTGGARRGLTSP